MLDKFFNLPKTFGNLSKEKLLKSNQTRMEMESDLERVVAEVVELRHQIFLKGEKNGNPTKLSVL